MYNSLKYYSKLRNWMQKKYLPGLAPKKVRQFYVWGEEVKRSIDWLIKRLIKVGARVSYHAHRWYVHVASAFPLSHHYRAVLAWGP